jgi:hypothetical protein
VLLLARHAESQGTDASGTQAAPPKILDPIFDYLNMAGTHTAANFQALDSGRAEPHVLEIAHQSNHVFEGGILRRYWPSQRQAARVGQGAAGYGKRVANITGQYAIKRTVTFGIGSLLHEDNRYFGSGKKGFWPSAGYAISISVLARHDNGRRYPSVSLIGGFAAAALSRSWQPPSTHSAAEGATSFGYSMGYNALACAVKEFLPGLIRPLGRMHRLRRRRRQILELRNNRGGWVQRF